MVYAEPLSQPRIRLINPNCTLSNITMPQIIRQMTFTRKALFMPVGLAVCASVVPRHWQVEIVDECTTDRPHQPRPDVDLVGITAMTTQANRGYELADAYRRLGVTVLMGGIHPSAVPEDALPHADAVSRGDGETTLPHMLADFQAGRLKRVYDWRDYPTAPIGTPRKDLLDPRQYLVFNPIQTTRGCVHSCNFCTTPGVFGREYRQREIADIVEEIRQAKAQFNTWCFIFADDNFAGNQPWALELCAALEPLKVKWASQCDILISENDKLLSAMRRSGCEGLILGLESPCQETLTEAGKQFVRSATYDWRIRKIQSYGIGLWGAFIFGFDTDDWRACMSACRFAQRMKLYMSCYPILTPYPGTRLYEEYLRAGRITQFNWDRYNGASVVYQPKRMSGKQLRHAQMAAFAEFYSPRSAAYRLAGWPIKSRSWLANLAIWRGISYYYARAGRRVPRFSDFCELGSRAWNYPDEPAEHPESLPAETLAATMVQVSDPLVRCARRLQQDQQPVGVGSALESSPHWPELS